MFQPNPKPCPKVLYKALSSNQPIPRQDVTPVNFSINLGESPISWFCHQWCCDIRLKRCIQSLESIQSPKPAKNEPLPKLKIRRNQNGFESELSEDPSKKSRDHDVIPSDDVIDLCDDDGVEVVSIKSAPSKKNSSGENPIRRTLRERHRPKRFEDYRTGNTPKSKLFKVSIDLN